MNTTQLANLKDLVANFPERLVRVDYYRLSAGCGCIVGEMLVRYCEVEPTELEPLGDYLDEWAKGESTQGAGLKGWADQLVDKFGLTPEEFNKIQHLNDERYGESTGKDDKALRAQAVKEHFIKIIERAEQDVQE